MRLQGKRVIVTGGGSGFSAAMARRFAAEGARVLVADLNEEAARSVAASIGETAVACRVDVADGTAYQAMVERALEAFGDLDTVVNNAGYTHRNQPLLDTDEATFDRVYDVNVKSIFHSMRACVPGCAELVRQAAAPGGARRQLLRVCMGCRWVCFTVSSHDEVWHEPPAPIRERFKLGWRGPVVGSDSKR